MDNYNAETHLKYLSLAVGGIQKFSKNSEQIVEILKFCHSVIEKEYSSDEAKKIKEDLLKVLEF